MQASLYSNMLRHILLPFADNLFFKQGLMKRLDFISQAQWWSRERVREFQLDQLRKLVHVAYHEVPMYRSLYDTAGVHPQDIHSLDDLRKLPIVEKDTFRSFPVEQIRRDTGYKVGKIFTSGSTGKSFFVYEDAPTSGIYRASLLLALEWAGWQIGEAHMQSGVTFKRSLDRKLKDMMMRCHYMSALELGDTQIKRNLEVMSDRKIEHIWGYPAAVYRMASMAAQLGWNQPIRSIATWGDNLTPSYRSVIESAFKTRVTDIYGCSEGIHVCSQAEEERYIIFSTDVMTEFIREDGSPADDDELSSIILTRLHPGCMPMIRYRVGDLGIRGSSALPSCGRGFETLQAIEGRDSDLLTTPEGNLLTAHTFTGAMKPFDEIDSFQVVQRSEDSILVRLCCKQPLGPGVKEKLHALLVKRGVGSLRVEYEEVDEIPLTKGGKHKFVLREYTE